MPNRNRDDVFQLVKSLGKGEKRYFKLYMQRNGGSGELKVVQLFDALDKTEEYDEAQLLKRNAGLAKTQLSNLKASLYRHILTSLRLMKDADQIDMQLHELLDHSRILYNKGLYMQALQTLERLKFMARQYYQFTYLEQAIFFERKIEAMYITRSMAARADLLEEESQKVQQRLHSVNALSNLSLQLYSWYIRHGHARNKRDREAVSYYFAKNLPADADKLKGFYERLYLYQSHAWLSFILQDYLKYYRATQRWVDLFEQEPDMVKVETIQYLKGLHNLVSAHYDLRNTQKFFEVLNRFEAFYQSPIIQNNHNYTVQAFIYLNTARIHRHYLEGSFTQGLSMVPALVQQLQDYELFIDRHRVLVFYYKIACLYFGAGKNEEAIDYLNNIIQLRADLRTDLQCYARLLHLIAHYELGNYDLLPYLARSVYRYMASMDNLSTVEEAMFAFIRESLHVSLEVMKKKLRALHDKLVRYENKASEARAFAYLDVVSWIESKLEGVPVEEVIRRKYQRIEK